MPSTNQLLASKVVVTESPPSVQTIQGVPTAIVGFIGISRRGPIATPKFITSFPQFVKTFGSYTANGNLAMAVQGFFENVPGGQLYISRTCHFTDPSNAATATAVAGFMNLLDRGGAATPAVATSNVGPFDLKPSQVLEVRFDGGSANTLTITATPASTQTAAGTFVLSDGMTLVYKTKLPGSAVFTRLHTITFHTADFVNIAAATAEEVEDAINKDPDAVGIKTSVSANRVTIKTDKQGSDAHLTLDASSTSLVALTLIAGDNAGSGNVTDINAVTATELATGLTALPITAGDTAVAVGGALVLTAVTTGSGGAIQITTSTTALGIFTGSLPINFAGSNALQHNTIKVSGADPGTWISDYKIVIADASSGDATRFNLSIVEIATGLAENWVDLSMLTNDSRYVVAYVNANSNLVVIQDLFTATAPQNNRPAKGTFTVWSSANNGLSGLADSDFTGNSAGGTGLNAFDLIDNITILVSPDRTTAGMHNAMATYCEVTRQKRTFAILDCPAGLDGPGIVNYVVTTAGLLELSEVTEISWPRGQIINPNPTVFGAANTIVVPTGGHFAGVYARADGSKPGGIYEAPAGLLSNYGVPFGIVGLETDQVNDEAVRDLISTARINPLCRVDGSPIQIDGHYTLKSTGDFPSIPERRGASFIEASVAKGIAIYKHRNNDRRLRQEVKETVSAFLLRQFDNGAFRGDTPSESFYVDVSDALNPPEIVFAGLLKINVGLATEKPVQWIVIDFTQDTRALDARLAQLSASTSTNAQA